MNQAAAINDARVRAPVCAVAVIFIAGCATTAGSDLAKVYDRKYNTTYPTKQSQSEFVATSANARESTKAKPGWYRYGHP